MAVHYYPQATKVQEVDADYDPSFLRHIFPRIEWLTLREAAEVMGALRIFSNHGQTLGVHRLSELFNPNIFCLVSHPGDSW